MTRSAEPGQFHRLAETRERPVTIRIDGEPATALVGDTLLTHGRHVRFSEFGEGPRAGFCLFGFCGHGFQLGTAAGAVIADLIVDGRTETEIGGLGIGRFLDPTP